MTWQDNDDDQAVAEMSCGEELMAFASYVLLTVIAAALTIWLLLKFQVRV